MSLVPEPSAVAAAFHDCLEAGMVAGLAFLANHFRKNRRLGRARDAVVSDTAKRSEEALRKNDEALKEFGSQLQVLAREGWSTASRVGVVEARLSAVEKSVELLQQDVRR